MAKLGVGGDRSSVYIAVTKVLKHHSLNLVLHIESVTMVMVDTCHCIPQTVNPNVNYGL